VAGGSDHGRIPAKRSALQAAGPSRDGPKQTPGPPNPASADRAHGRSGSGLLHGSPKEPPRSRGGVLIKFDKIMSEKARLISQGRGIPMAEYLSEPVRPIIDRDYVKLMWELEVEASGIPGIPTEHIVDDSRPPDLRPATSPREVGMTIRAWMILVAEAAVVLALVVFMDAYSGSNIVWAWIGLFATWIVGVTAYLVRLAGRPRSRSGTATLGLVAAGVAVYLGMSLVIPPPLVPMIAGATLAGAMVYEAHRGNAESLLGTLCSVLIASGGLLYLAWFIRVAGYALLVAQGWLPWIRRTILP
jgi:hypothetical protein